jgi:hypothetical protein
VVEWIGWMCDGVSSRVIWGGEGNGWLGDGGVWARVVVCGGESSCSWASGCDCPDLAASLTSKN